MTSISPAAASSPPGSRLHGLDGLRGLAALVVVVHHTALTFPAFSAAYFAQTVDATWAPGSLSWWASHTPLHVLWDGEAAVMVFFILSGFVLTLPVLRPDRVFRWDAYLPQRLARLYLPVWGALAFAILMILVTPRGTNDASEWLRRRTDHLTLEAVLHGMLQLDDGAELLSPLWTIRWEVLFSLLLGLFIWFGRRGRPSLMIVVCLVLIGVGDAAGVEPLRYLPMFLIGVVLAVHRDALVSPATRLSRRVWIGALAATPILISSQWMLPPAVPEPIRDATTSLRVLGALILVAACIRFPHSRLLGSRVVQWLGRVSFSLYLVHETIVIATADLAGAGRGLLVPAIAIPVSLLAAQLFFVAVERPCHRLARRVHAAIAGG